MPEIEEPLYGQTQYFPDENAAVLAVGTDRDRPLNRHIYPMRRFEYECAEDTLLVETSVGRIELGILWLLLAQDVFGSAP
jgi:hypothetical protein